jgi:hypothetical protein
LSSHESLSALRARVRELEEEVVRRRSEAAAMAAAARLAGEFLPVEELAERVVETIMELFDAGSACIRRLDPDGGLVALAWAGTPGTPAFQRGHVLPRGMATARGPSRSAAPCGRRTCWPIPTSSCRRTCAG